MVYRLFRVVPLFRYLPLLLFLAAAHCRPAAAPSAPPGAAPRNLVLIIADGFGPPIATLSRQIKGAPLSMDADLVGAVATDSADSPVTDSASSATAYSCGIRTKNRTVGVDQQGRRCASVLNAFHNRGFYTAVITNTRITHATPAAFTAFSDSRENENEIALEQLNSPVDLLLGGGRRHFRPEAQGGKREDQRDLLAQIASGGRDLALDWRNFRLDPSKRTVALFGDDHMPYAIDRRGEDPQYADIVRRAMQQIVAQPKPYFVMIEVGRIDHAGHDNDAAAMVQEALEYDRIYAVLREMLGQRGDTLLLATADHETGGLSLASMQQGQPVYDYRYDELRGIRASALTMADEIRAGATLEETLRRYTGSAALSDEQRQRFDEIALQPANLRFAVASILSERAGIAWGTYGHTGVDVGLYASGPGSEAFRGVIPNWQLIRRAAALFGIEHPFDRR